MAITRWNDMLKEMAVVQDRMNRFFENFGRDPGQGPGEGVAAGLWAPAVDIYETDDAVVVNAELPGLEKNQVSVEVRDGVLTLRGERKAETKVKGEYIHRIERSYGSFARSFELPRNVDPEKIKASLKDGILEIRIPKTEEAKPRRIEVAA